MHNTIQDCSKHEFPDYEETCALIAFRCEETNIGSYYDILCSVAGGTGSTAVLQSQPYAPRIDVYLEQGIEVVLLTRYQVF